LQIKLQIHKHPSFSLITQAPTPSAGTVMMLVVYTTAFGSPPGGSVPAGLGYIFAFDWLLDRLGTMFNVLGDLAVTAIIANKVNKDVANNVTDVEDALVEEKEGRQDE
jgi:Na+/H+-dicarboxylate symporter